MLTCCVLDQFVELVFILLVHWSYSSYVHMPIRLTSYPDIGLTRLSIELTIFVIRVVNANHCTTEAVCSIS